MSGFIPSNKNQTITETITSTNNSVDNEVVSALGTWAGTGELNSYTGVFIFVTASSNCDVFVEFSLDNNVWSTSLLFKYDTTRINPPHTFEKANRYFRIRVVDTSNSTNTISVLTSYGSYGKLTAPINGTLAENYDATVVRPTEYRYEVAMGKRQGRTTINKWGYNLDVDGTDNTIEELVASWGGTFDPNTDIISTAQTFTISYNITTDGLGQTGATQLLISYLDENFNLQDSVHILSNTGSDITAFTGLGINRVLVLANGGAGWNVNAITLTATTDATTQAQIPALKSVTQQLIYHTPINHNLLLDWFRGNILKLSGGGGSPAVTIKAYSYSRVTQTRYEVLQEDIDSTVENQINLEPSQPFNIGGREVVYFVVSTDTNNTRFKGRFSGILERIV